MTDKIVVLTTCDSEKQASLIARQVVEQRLAACASIIPGARSIYRWKGNVEEAEEFVLVIKTSRAHFDRLRSAIEKIHTYEVPEIIALPVVDGAEAYLAWLDRELAS
jgi:periplasmic divalent cation tolerance protein